MKKIFSIAFVFVFIMNCLTIVAFAESTDSESAIENPQELCDTYLSTADNTVIVERFDVSIEDAALDPTFSIHSNMQYKSQNSRSTTSTTWVVEGVTYYSGANNFYSQAAGHSAEYNGTTLLNTYHYTRTFFGTTLYNLGDSGRVWDSGDVWAYGPLVPTGQVSYMIQRVYYGTTE